jgi:LPS export ABC transporter permease LptF/LPS export ABC transporter permease LptG
VRILDRYLVREIAIPLLLGLTVLTFVLQLPPILQQGEEFIARGVEWRIVARALFMLLPQALCLTIPMAVLLGILVGFGRVSADREFVAMQACGISLARLARPVLFVASLGTAATAYETIVALPDANQTYREIVAVVLAQHVESTVKPRIFFQEFPNKVIYVREVPPEGGWKDVFLADTSNPNETTVYFAKQGRVRLDRENKRVQLELIDATANTTHADKPDAYEENAFEHLYLTLDPASVFKDPPTRGVREMTGAELRREIAEAATRNDPAYDARFMLQQKLSLPLACPILALIGLALGATNRKDGKLASFAIGTGVIFLYYVLLWGSRAVALGGQFSPELAPWMPNLVLGVAGVFLFFWRSRRADQPIRFSIPTFWRRTPEAAGGSPLPAPAKRVVVVLRLPRLNIPRPRILDLYLSREYLRVLFLGMFALLGIFYISTFIDLVDKLFRGEATGAMLFRYFVFRTPQFVYFIIPMGVLVSTLVTIGLFTKSGELLVMRACGISLYRSALPLFFFAALASGVLYVMQERVLTSANREADQLERTIRRWPAAINALNRRWVVGTQGELYHYDVYDQTANRFLNLLVYRLDDKEWRLRSVTSVAEATLAPKATGDESGDVWIGRQGWTKTLPPNRRVGDQKAIQHAPFEESKLALESADYFKADEPVPELMTYAQLSDYIARQRQSGANVMRQMVALQRKISFPFVTLIMTLLAVPFGVTMGRRGAMAGIAIGIVMAITYWVTMSVFGALGTAGAMPALLAAWAPNLLFGAAAAFMVLTVRT